MAAAQEMRAARRRRRLGTVAWGDLAYRVYTTALAALVLAVFASGLVGDEVVSSAAADAARRQGPAWAGLAVAVMLLAGVRSGSRGGPLALEAADVHHLLLAPLPRSVALRRPVAGVLGYGVGGAAVVGGLAGSLFAQRLPGSNRAWVLCGALFSATAVCLSLGAALLTASRRLPRAVPLVAAGALLAWSALHASEIVTVSPAAVVGWILFWPLDLQLWGLLGVAAAAGVAVLGVVWIGGLAIEAARARTRLVGQLRFAVTQQDLRSVLLLRRQLAAERPRSRPLLRRLPGGMARRLPVLTRDVESFLRWPTVRVVRVLVLGATAGLALRGVWSGTTPLVLVAGLAGYLAALDALEPLAQEVDHPTLMASYPVHRGLLLVHHLAAPVLLMLVVGGVGLLAAWAVAPTVEVLRIGAVTVVTGALSSVAGAAISVVSEVVLDQSGAAMLPPEVAGPRVAIRTLWPPLVAVLGTAPVLVAQRATRAGVDMARPAFLAAAAVVVLVWIVVGWVRYRDDLHRSMREAMEGGAR